MRSALGFERLTSGGAAGEGSRPKSDWLMSIRTAGGLEFPPEKLTPTVYRSPETRRRKTPFMCVADHHASLLFSNSFYVQLTVSDNAIFAGIARSRSRAY
jgi:hypothetical protein